MCLSACSSTHFVGPFVSCFVLRYFLPLTLAAEDLPPTPLASLIPASDVREVGGQTVTRVGLGGHREGPPPYDCLAGAFLLFRFVGACVSSSCV